MSAGGTITFDRRLSIQSVGMVSSVGLDAASSCAAIRARISRFEEIPFHDREWQPIIGAPVTAGVLNRQGYRRLAPMLCRAVRECMSLHGTHVSLAKESVPLLVAIDDLSRPDYPRDLPKRLLAEVQETLGMQFPQTSQVFTEGTTGFFHALERARQLITNSHINACVVAAVDSLLNASALKWLENRDRLLTEQNSDGVIPGEAAAALWITKAQTDGSSMLDILGLGFGEETSVLDQDQPNLALGLADALRQALSDARMSLHEIDFRVGGMTGEQLSFKEASTAIARVQRVHKNDFDLWVPAEMLGDVGAALPACMLVVTAIAILKSYAPGRSAMLYVSSNSSQRAACVVVAPRGNRHGK